MRAKRKNVCQTCRSRKLACDGKQPACSQCALRRLSCSGYRQDFIFVNQSSSETQDQAELKDDSKPVQGYRTKTLGVLNEARAWPVSSYQLAWFDGTGTQSERRCCSELEDHIQFIVQLYDPVNRNIPAESNPHHNQMCGAWVEVLPIIFAAKRNKQFLSSTLKTLATALRYHNLGNELCQHQMLKMYCDSLEQMGKALKEAQGAFHIEHAIAIMCLALTDSMIPALKSGWMIHVNGFGDWAERMGPEPFSNGILHTLFIGFKPLLLISSILNRRKTFLAREEWITTPLRRQPASIMQLLLDKASELPALLQRYDGIGDLGDVSQLAAIKQLWEDFRNILRSLREWELISQSQAPSPLVWLRPNPGDFFPSDMNVLWFPNIMTANSLTYCWAFEIVAKTHLDVLGRAITTALGCNQRLSLWALSDSTGNKPVAALAEMICDSMSYLMQPEMGLYGPGSAFFTLATAVHVFQSEPERYRLQLSRYQQIVDQLASIGIYFPLT